MTDFAHIAADALPTAEDWARVLTLRDYNTRLVVFGTFALGLAAGLVGSFTLLRKRALMGDALSHATLPGIAIAFIVATAMGGAAKSLVVLLIGAVVTGVLGVATILALRQYTRLKEDAALGVVLSVYFGAGVAMLGIVQQLGSGSAAGLESFIYGKTASMVPGDVWLIGGVGVAAAVVCGLLFKEFKLLCFDADYARAQGWPTLTLDVVMMGLVVAVTVVGLQAVGLVLVIAMLIIPAAAARFWTDRTGTMAMLSALIGGTSAAIGAAASALVPRLPSGATIVLVEAALFGTSMLFGTARGVLPRWRRRRQLERDVGRQHFLRAAFELAEQRGGGGDMKLRDLLDRRSWSVRQLRKLAHIAEAAGRVVFDGDSLRLTDSGAAEARRVARNHRLWELYLINHADTAPAHVDRGADRIEHVVDPDIVAELERQLDASPEAVVPESPHLLMQGGLNRA